MQSDITFRSNPAGDPASAAAFANVPIGIPDNNAYVDRLRTLTSGPISVVWENTGGADIDYQILGANDEATADAMKKVVDSGTIAAGAAAQTEIPLAYYCFYWFQQKDSVGGDHGASNISGRQARI
jgi:hypothetical protein